MPKINSNFPHQLFPGIVARSPISEHYLLGPLPVVAEEVQIELVVLPAVVFTEEPLQALPFDHSLLKGLFPEKKNMASNELPRVRFLKHGKRQVWKIYPGRLFRRVAHRG